MTQRIADFMAITEYAPQFTPVTVMLSPPSKGESMHEALKQVGAFARSVLSESQAEGSGGSASRVTMLLLAAVCGGALIWMTRHVCEITDPLVLTPWLAAMPVVIASMSVLIVCPYAVRKASSSLGEIAEAMAKR